MPSICACQQRGAVKTITRRFFSSTTHINTASPWIATHNEQNQIFFVTSSVYGTVCCTIEIQHAHIFHITCRTCLSNYGSSDWADTILFNAKYLSTTQSDPEHLRAISSKFTRCFNSLLGYATHELQDIWCRKFPHRTRQSNFIIHKQLHRDEAITTRSHMKSSIPLPSCLPFLYIEYTFDRYAAMDEQNV